MLLAGHGESSGTGQLSAHPAGIEPETHLSWKRVARRAKLTGAVAAAPARENCRIGALHNKRQRRLVDTENAEIVQIIHVPPKGALPAGRAGWRQTE